MNRFFFMFCSPENVCYCQPPSFSVKTFHMLHIPISLSLTLCVCVSFFWTFYYFLVNTLENWSINFQIDREKKEIDSTLIYLKSIFISDFLLCLNLATKQIKAKREKDIDQLAYIK